MNLSLRCWLPALCLASTLSVAAQTRQIDSLRQVVALHSQDTSELEARLNLVYQLTRTDLSAALRTALETAALAKKLDEPGSLASSYAYLVTIHRETGKIDSARYYLDKIEQLCNAHPANSKMRVSFLRTAGLFHKNNGEYRRALPFMLESIQLWDQQDEVLAGQFLNLGNVYFNLAEFKPAADYHLKALRLFETLKNPRGQSFCLQSLGNDFTAMNQFLIARDYLERSYRIKEELDDRRGMLTSTLTLGDVYKELGEYRKAEKYYELALAMARKMAHTAEEARTLQRWGLLHRHLENLDKARDFFMKSLSLSNRAGDSIMAARTKSELASLDLVEQNGKIQSEAQLLDRLSTLVKTGDRRLEATEYARLSEYYAAKREFEKAYHYLGRYHDLIDSVKGNDVLLQLKELEETYKSEKSEQEIALLKKDQALKELEVARHRANTTNVMIVLISVVVIGVISLNRYRVLNRTRRQLEMEKMRNDIARDLHDDLGSALSSINIMSQMALQEGISANGNYFRRINEQSSRMMENISDMVWSIKADNDSLEQLVVKMKEFAGEILEPADILYQLDEDPSIAGIRLDVYKRKNLFLVFKEALNNAAKYSRAHNMTIALTTHGGWLSLRVRDDGCGFDMTSPGTGNGLRNMEERTRAMAGTIRRSSSSDSGTEIEVSIPIT